MTYEDEAMREWAWNAGYESHYIDVQWLCHPSFADCYVQNPHYHGPEQPHPMLDCLEDYE